MLDLAKFLEEEWDAVYGAVQEGSKCFRRNQRLIRTGCVENI